MEVAAQVWSGFIKGFEMHPWMLMLWGFMLGFAAGQKMLRWLQGHDASRMKAERKIIEEANRVVGVTGPLVEIDEQVINHLRDEIREEHQNDPKAMMAVINAILQTHVARAAIEKMHG